MYNLDNVGVVVKIEGDEAVVMTDEAVFERVKRQQDMFPGQKILVKKGEILIKNRKNIRFYYSAAAGLAAVMVLIIAYLIGMNFNSNSTYAYINVDINPSLELKINDKEVVTEVKSLNDDGEKLFKGTKVKGLKINQALKIIIDKSIDCGYFKKEKEKNYILIAAALDKSIVESEERNLKQQKKLDEYLDGLRCELEESYGNVISPKVFKVPSEYREKANENNISMGKYLIYSEAKKTGKDISMAELKSDDLYNLLCRIEKETAGESAPDINASSKVKPTPATSTSYTPRPVTAASPTEDKTKENYPKGKTSVINATAQSLVIVTTIPPVSQKAENAVCRGLKGEYYDNSDFTGLKITRTDPEINFRWAEGSPDPSIGKDTFSVRWTGMVVPRFSEKYTFSTYADDGVRLWVNNTLIIDNWKSQSSVTTKGTMDLVAGTRYDIRLEFFENVKACQVKLFWESKSQKSEIVPSCQLCHYTSVYQAEKAFFSRSVTETKNAGYTGDSYVNFINEIGSYIEWTVDAAKSGTYTLNFGYANGTSTNRPLEIKVNSKVTAKSMDFNSTSAWTDWRSNAIIVNLNKGINIIRATAITADGGPNIDCLEIL